MRLDEVVSGVKTDLGVKIYGDSLELLQQKAEAILRVVERVPGAEGATVGVSDGALQLEIDLDRPAIARYGLNVAHVREAIETGVGGTMATQVLSGRRRFDVVVRLDNAYRNTPEAVGRTLVRTPAGGTVTLSQVARLRTIEVPEVVNHENGQRYVVVQSNVRGRDLGSFVRDVERAIGAQVSLPPGYFVTYGGQFANQQRAARRLALIVPGMLLLIGVLLYAQLRLGTPRTGGDAQRAVRADRWNRCAVAARTQSQPQRVGRDDCPGRYRRVERTRDVGVHRTAACWRTRLGRRRARGGRDVRFRPVLMTALVASAGFIPMAISTSAGAEVQRPLATVVIGGLVSATLLTLLVLPTVYQAVEEWSIRRSGRQVMEIRS